MKRFTRAIVGLTVVVLAGIGIGKVYADATPREPIQTGNAVVSRIVQLERYGYSAYQDGIQRFGAWLEDMLLNPNSVY
jgi:hypothetical protein